MKEGTRKGYPSMSKSALLLSPCLAWADLRSKWYDEDRIDPKDTEKRDRGVSFHAAISSYNDSGCTSTIIPEHWDAIAGVMLTHATKYLRETLHPRFLNIVSELAVEVDWRDGTSRILAHVKDRNYPNLKGRHYGTADLVGVTHDAKFYIADWKTGGTEGAEEQLLSLAYAVVNWSKHSDAHHDRHKSCIISCLQVNEEGVWPHEREVTFEELEQHAQAMQWQVERIGTEGARLPVLGAHCIHLYCPHLAFCSEVSKVVEEAATADQSGGL